jgi:chromosome segregation ATPase
LIAEINRLQRDLDRANESIDDKLDKLEDAGLGVVGLTKKLEDARSRFVFLEDEIARLSRREDRRIRRLERVRCQKCHAKVDLRSVVASAEIDERYVAEPIIFRVVFLTSSLFFSVRSKSRQGIFHLNLRRHRQRQVQP